MEKIIEKKYCCGCLSCVQKCPKNAIKIVVDSGGFKYPEINKDKCINCGLCRKCCPVLKDDKNHEKTTEAYACINKDKNTRLNSSSGGIFSLIATNILKKGGYVVGAVFNKSSEVVHKIINNLEELSNLYGSKYVQSDTNEIYRQVEDLLKKQKLVLFTGTPCQIAGLYSFLRKEYTNLITQDIICHGVPSPKLWSKYIELQKEKNGHIKSINMRAKQNGWKNYNMQIRFDKKTNEYLNNHNHDDYMKLFLSDICLRESCYNCQFKRNKKQISDITLGDFWGIENIVPEMDDDLGVSLVLINSDKGKKLFEEIANRIEIKSVDFNEAAKYNTALFHSVKEPKNRTKFFSDIDKIKFKKIAKKYVNNKNVLVIVRKIGSRIKQFLIYKCK